ncbi:MAG: hypothetical protein NWE91_01910 [Candidatus Bathyarchaeota archaeon]|nr:hypothetical protein [Candidatus Bathyarchaeota archaeon]
MTKEAVIRQFFSDFIENLGCKVNGYEEFDEEECNMILTDLFFAGRLEIKWNPKAHTLMLKPKIVINLKK